MAAVWTVALARGTAGGGVAIWAVVLDDPAAEEEKIGAEKTAGIVVMGAGSE